MGLHAVPSEACMTIKLDLEVTLKLVEESLVGLGGAQQAGSDGCAQDRRRFAPQNDFSAGFQLKSVLLATSPQRALHGWDNTGKTIQIVL